MSARVSDLLSGLAPSATLAVDAKAKALKAAGEPVIGFGAGEPDFPTPVHIVEAAAKACYDPVNYKYTPTRRICPNLREAIVAQIHARQRTERRPPSQVLVTNGGKHAVATAFMTVLNPGDEVLIPAPYWTTYPESVYLSRRDARAGDDAVRPTDFASRVEELERARTQEDEDARLHVARRTLRGPSCGPTTSRRSAGGPPSTTSGCSVTRSTSTSSTATPTTSRCRSWRPSSAIAGSSSTASRRPTP